MNSNQPKPAPTAPREYAIPDEECLPKYFKEPAPTAEEQPEFPPLDDTQKERDNSLAMMPDNPKAALYRAMCTCRERQLLAALVERDAALRSNREKDAQLAELTEDVGLAKYERNQYDAAHRREVVNVLKLSAQLRAVSEALKGYKPDDDVFAIQLVARLRSIVDGKD